VSPILCWLKKPSRRDRPYSIRGTDSPVTVAAIRVNVAPMVFAIVSALFGTSRELDPGASMVGGERMPPRIRPKWRRRLHRNFPLDPDEYLAFDGSSSS
jgi:hypothetical protein